MLYGSFNISNSMIDQYDGNALDAIFAHPGMLALAHARELTDRKLGVVHCDGTKPIALTTSIVITIDGLAAEMFGAE
jgi:hypothetical protein